MDELTKYAKERDKMLKKRSVKALKKFVNKNAEYYSPMFVDAINRAEDKVLEITLHKMIVHCTNLPDNLRIKSGEWLINRGFSLDIGES